MNQDIRIDRLSLRVPGLDEDAARELAQLIAERLATSDYPIPDFPSSEIPKTDYPISDFRVRDFRGSGGLGSGRLSVQVTGDATKPDVLARLIAAEIRRVIQLEARR